VRRDECLQLGDVRPAECKPGLHLVLDHAEASFGEAGDMPASEVGVGDVGECRPAPQAEGLGERVRGPGGILGAQGPAPDDEAVEPHEVDGVIVNGQPIAGRVRFDHEVGQRTAQPGDQRLQGVRRPGRPGVTPHAIDEPLGGDHAAGAEGEQDEQRAQAGSADLDGPAGAIGHLEGTQQPDPHQSILPCRSVLDVLRDRSRQVMSSGRRRHQDISRSVARRLISVVRGCRPPSAAGPRRPGMAVFPLTSSCRRSRPAITRPCPTFPVPGPGGTGGYADQVERSLLDSPSYRLIRALGRHKALIAGALERHGLHVGQEFYLAQLWREDGITSADLAARAGVSAPAVTKVVGGLERSGLVRRRRDPADARLVRIWLTDAGRDLREPVTAIWYDSERAFWGGLSDEERTQVREAVGSLLD
jgi:DNA-binding MarR family transcriptional regulator